MKKEHTISQWRSWAACLSDSSLFLSGGSVCSYRYPFHIATYDRSDILKTIANRYIDGIFPDSTESSPFRYAVFCTQDGYGRELWYAHAVDGDIYGEGLSPSSTTRRFDLALILAPDGNRNSQNCVIEIENMIESPQQIAAFKCDNGWNTHLTQ